MRRYLRFVVFAMLAVASVLLAPMLFVLGLWAMRGMPPHISLGDCRFCGTCAVGGAVLLWLSTAACSSWLQRGSLRFRFGLRTILIAVTIAALRVGFIMSLAPPAP